MPPCGMLGGMRRLLETFSVPLAIVLAGIIIGAAIVAAQVIAPYRIAEGINGGLWRVNAITGNVDVCAIAYRGCQPVETLARLMN